MVVDVGGGRHGCRWSGRGTVGGHIYDLVGGKNKVRLVRLRVTTSNAAIISQSHRSFSYRCFMPVLVSVSTSGQSHEHTHQD